MSLWQRLRGGTLSPPRVSLSEILWSWLGGFLGIGLVAYLNYKLLAGTDLMLITGSLGASALLIYGAIKSPFAQPRNLMGGHLLSALIGVASYQLLQPHIWLAAAVAVATSIAAMHATRTPHPPGSATALIAVIGDDKIHALGYFYAVMPIGVGAAILLIVALVVNNIPKNRRYPEYWF
jgi:CBS-domain-containing membrane protein